MTWDALKQLDPWIQSAFGLAALLALAYVLRAVVRMALLQVVPRIRAKLHPALMRTFLSEHILGRAAQVVPSLVIQTGIAAVPHLPAMAVVVIRNVAIAVTVYQVVLLVFAMLDGALSTNETRIADDDSTRSIKSYVQLAKLLITLVAGIIMVSTLIDRSPTLLLSGLGAMSAVLMLVFKDTILSFTAGVQLASNDLLRVGDWLEMRQIGADGTVEDMALNTVKIRNWDNTITTIPTWRLMSDSFINWRGMHESGARRIQRSLLIDINAIRFLADAEVQQLHHIALLGPYLATAHTGMTNVGAFRAYANAYLKAQPQLRQDMALLARMMEPTAEGVPLQVYAFAATTDWAAYEAIQGELFDHLSAMLPTFGLLPYQESAGTDVALPLQASESKTLAG